MDKFCMILGYATLGALAGLIVIKSVAFVTRINEKFRDIEASLNWRMLAIDSLDSRLRCLEREKTSS
jgi:hypothetical protein